MGLFEEERAEVEADKAPELPTGIDLVRRAFTGVFCSECNAKDGHFRSCSRFIPSEFDQPEMNRIASLCIGSDGLNEPVTLCYIHNEPHVVVEVVGDQAAEVIAYPVLLLPLANLGDPISKRTPEVGDNYIGRLINCGSKKNPNWWVIIGPRKIFKIGGEARTDDDRNIEEALRSALHTFDGAEERWRPLIVNGATDAELMSAISRELGLGGGSNRHGGYKYKGGTNPEFSWQHYSGRTNQTQLKGKRLLAKVRAVMEIGPPGPTLY